jgi:hypothetical protein
MRRFFHTIVLLFLFIFAANTCLAESALIFPVIANTQSGACGANCEYWSSFPSVFNPNDQPVTVTFTTYDSNGNVIASSGAVTAGAFQTAIIPPSVGSLRTGWLKVSGSQPLVGREYVAFFRVSAGVQDLRSRIYLSPAPLSKRHFIRPEAFGPVGISIVFPGDPNDRPTRGKLIHRETDGSTVSEKELVIVPNGQVIGYLRDLLPPASSTLPVEPLSGSVEIVFDREVAVTALQFAASEPLEESVEALTGAIPSQ